MVELFAPHGALDSISSTGEGKYKLFQMGGHTCNVSIQEAKAEDSPV